MKQIGLVLVALLAGCASQPQVGRYQLVAEQGPPSGGPGQTFVIDTATGQVWNDRDRDFSSPKLPATRP